MDIIEERYALSCGRVGEIAALQDVALDYKDYFKKTADFILMVIDACDNKAKKKAWRSCGRRTGHCMKISAARTMSAAMPIRHLPVRSLAWRWAGCSRFCTQRCGR